MIEVEQILNIYEPDNCIAPNYMKTDIKEREGNYLLEIEIPCFIKEDIKAELIEGVLSIIAKKPDNIEKEENKDNYVRRERTVSGFKRNYYVGKRIKHEHITAAYRDGILSIIIANPDISVDGEKQKLINIH